MKFEYLQTEEGNSIAYQQISGRSPGILFLGGLMSDMQGTKASYLAEFCRNIGQNFIRFDYYGHGASAGKFQQGTIGRWMQDALTVLDALTTEPQILVGSSMGGWLMILVARERKNRIAGLVGIASAPDFTKTIVDSLDLDQKNALDTYGVYYLSSDDQVNIYPIIKSSLDEGMSHHILEGPIEIHCPVRLLHGLKDDHVPWQQSLRLCQRLESSDVEVTLIKNGDHRLARDSDLDLLGKTIQEIITDIDSSN